MFISQLKWATPNGLPHHGSYWTRPDPLLRISRLRYIARLDIGRQAKLLDEWIQFSTLAPPTRIDQTPVYVQQFHIHPAVDRQGTYIHTYIHTPIPPRNFLFTLFEVI